MHFQRLLPTALFIFVMAAGCAPAPQQPPAEQSAAQQPAQPIQSPVERGRYLVNQGLCEDCHTPKTFGPAGPAPDKSRDLSGHPATEKLPPIPGGLLAPDRWGAITNNGFTAWVGPWGVSFARNLTPDVDTGLGSWTEEMFVTTLRDGKHQGAGRPLLPPMPWQAFKQVTDDDIKAIFAYLRSLPPVRNPVPDPIPPEKLPK